MSCEPARSMAEINAPDPLKPDQTYLAVEGKVEPKAGWRTTEFWLSIAAATIGALATSGMFADGSTAMRVVGIAGMVLAALGYSVARGMAKKS